MENKNNKGIIIILITIIVILSVLCILFATGTINLKNNNIDNKPTVDFTNNEIENENSTANNITVEKIKEIFRFAYDYRELPFVYCGEEYDATTSTNGEMPKYYVSNEFTTYDDMLNNLKKYMSIEVISNATYPATNQDLYKEENNKLYCEMTYKGYMYGRGNIEIEITSQTKNKVVCVATMELTDPGENKSYDKVNLVLEQKENKWIITNYENKKN